MVFMVGLYYQKDTWCVYDNHATNGITINQKRIIPNEEHELKIDDVIIFGRDFEDTEFRYTFTTLSCAIAELHGVR